MDEYVETISHNNNNNHYKKSKKKNSDTVDATSTFIEIHTDSDDLSFKTSSSSFTTSSFATLNPTIKKKTVGDEICKTMLNHHKVQERGGEIQKITPNHSELIPCDTVCIDLVGPYTVTDQKGNNGILNALAFVDTATC